jgi:hypothetical protein
MFVPIINSDWACPVLNQAVVSALLDFGGFALGQFVPAGKHAKHISFAVLMNGSVVEHIGDTARHTKRGVTEELVAMPRLS